MEPIPVSSPRNPFSEDDLPLVEAPPEFDGLDWFIVGGFNRDALRGIDRADVDLAVGGVTPEELLDRGFRPIEGSNFPVFLDSLGREVAMLREERSTGDHHTDFEAVAIDANVPIAEALERDLERRDLTVNAIASDSETGTMFDPHGGIDDLRDGNIRPVSDAFLEDPLRVVRAARFAARLDATVVDEAQPLLREATEKISEEAVPPERLAEELRKTFKQAEQPSVFFRVLDAVEGVDALARTFPEVGALRGVPAGPPEFHKEGDAFDHTLLVLDEFIQRRPEDVVGGFAALAHDFGKPRTPADTLPNHHGHDGPRGVAVVEEMADRLRLSNEEEAAMSAAVTQHMKFHDIEDLNATTVLDMVPTLGHSLSVEQAVALAEADAAGRLPKGEVNSTMLRNRLQAALTTKEQVTGKDAIDHLGHDPDDVGSDLSIEKMQNQLRQMRAERIRALW